jgi:DNA-binding NtrC family response regulator
LCNRLPNSGTGFPSEGAALAAPEEGCDILARVKEDRLELVVFVGDDPVRHALPSAGSVTIGRTTAADVHIPDASVSRRHAVLHVGPKLLVEDLGSVNGTRVQPPGPPETEAQTNDLRRRPGETFEVALGDHILFGSVTSVLRRAAGTPSASAPPGARDPAMQAVYDEARLAARGTINVLVLGETGAGKEVLAREIHRLSPRAPRPFVALHCAALSASLLESELFGHEKGAFTGASEARPGLIESADGGTVFLDEIGEISLETQAKLLRVVEDRSVLRVGARRPRQVDVRFVSATNRDLEAEVARGAFREDLYYRLGGISLRVPPLRERPSEIEPLARLFLQDACARMNREPIAVIDEGALAALRAHAWPGNVRELRNAMERAAVLCTGGVVEVRHLPPRVTGAARPPAASPSPIAGTQSMQAVPRDASPAPPSIAGPASTPAPPSGRPTEPPGGLRAPIQVGTMEDLAAARAELERRSIVEALERCGGNQTRAAELLGISRRTLQERLGRYDLPRPRKPK